MNKHIEKKLIFIKEKETKNTVRFQEIRENGNFIIGPLYVQKSFLKDINIPKISITIKI